MGVDDEWLLETEREQHRMNYHVLLVQDDVVHPAIRSSASAAAAARATGGAVIADPDQLAREIERLDTAVQTTTTHPARSVWWMVLFSALLCAEWTLRRRAGLR